MNWRGCDEDVANAPSWGRRLACTPKAAGRAKDVASKVGSEEIPERGVREREPSDDGGGHGGLGESWGGGGNDDVDDDDDNAQGFNVDRFWLAERRVGR